MPTFHSFKGVQRFNSVKKIESSVLNINSDFVEDEFGRVFYDYTMVKTDSDEERLSFEDVEINSPPILMSVLYGKS